MSQPHTYIYRLTHYRNLEFILTHGLHCANCGVIDPDFVNIGYRTLMARRETKAVTAPPGGFLPDYVPFFFCPRPVMLLPIANGRVADYNGSQNDILYLISSAQVVREAGLDFVFTNRHAVLEYTHFFNNLEDLERLDWNKIRTEQWGIIHDESRQTKEIKQAEFLVHRHVPPHCIKAIACATQETFDRVKPIVDGSGFAINLRVRPDYYY